MLAARRDESPQYIEFSVLGSGSSGNASLVRSSGTRLLVDAGMSCRQITLRLESLGQDPAGLDAILLTHEHHDHVSGLPLLCRRFPEIPVYVTSKTKRIVEEKLDQPPDWQIIPGKGTFVLGDFEVSTFPVPHDAIEPLGFTVRNGSTQLGIVTDAGHVTDTMKARLAGSQGLFIETNHDLDLLEADTRRPWGVKQRIMGLHGHLSNRQAVELIDELLHTGLRHLVCGHLSSDCNTPEKVKETVGEVTTPGGEPIGLLVSGRREPTPLLRIHHTAPADSGPGRRYTVAEDPDRSEADSLVQDDLFGTC